MVPVCIVSTRAVDPDSHGSAFLFPPGSGSGGENLREKTEQIQGKWKKIVILF